MRAEVRKLGEQRKSFNLLAPTLRSHISSSTTDNQRPTKYFTKFISKASQALTDPISREKYGHPDRRQGFQMGIALPQFLLNIDGASAGILLLWIVGICTLLPLVIAVVYLSRSSKYTGNYVNASDITSLLPLDETIFGTQDVDRFWRMPECYLRGNTINYL